jgi:hypothetical protein
MRSGRMRWTELMARVGEVRNMLKILLECQKVNDHSKETREDNKKIIKRISGIGLNYKVFD